MPTYDYICDDCGHEFEAFESIKADPQRVCPTCQKETLRRKIGAGAAILFKGSGFYITDYRSDSYKKAAKADSNSGGSCNGGGPAAGCNGPGCAPAKSDSKSTSSAGSSD